MRKIVALTFVLLLALAGFALPAPDADATGFCAVETHCGADCYCGPPYNAVVPAWWCPESVCYDNKP
jgi:hypothetical protein